MEACVLDATLPCSGWECVSCAVYGSNCISTLEQWMALHAPTRGLTEQPVKSLSSLSYICKQPSQAEHLCYTCLDSA